jgi:hypothetical protein
VLVPPHNLPALLQQIVLKLPRDVSFITGTEVDYMNVYYSVARVQAYSTAGSIRLVGRIPLRESDSYDVSSRIFANIRGLETTNSNSTEAKFFAVMENWQYYALLGETHIRHCEQGAITICDATFPLIHKRVPTCE